MHQQSTLSGPQRPPHWPFRWPYSLRSSPQPRPAAGRSIADGPAREVPILEAGRNCCAVVPAARAAVLVDAAEYFSTLADVLGRARHSILILGWDFDARISLTPEADDPQPLGKFLRALIETRPALEIRVLVWNLAAIQASSKSVPLLFGAEWLDHPRIQLWLDHNHPLYGSQHQKVICIDETLAFVGGIDLTSGRWDTCDHAARDSRRITPDGEAYAPVHDAELLVEGEAAQVVAKIARDRWRQATGEALAPAPGSSGLWPDGIEQEFMEVPVGISRTIPHTNHEDPVQEVCALNFDAIGSARRSVYIEAQYLADPALGDVLEPLLAADDGPEILAVVAHALHGRIEEWVMGGNRDRLVRRLKRADRHGRFRAMYPVIQGTDGPCEIFVHSKVMIIDDRLLRIGSANLNRRSTCLDTECDLSLEAVDERGRRAVAGIRTRLLAEHLGTSPGELTAEIESRGSILAAVDTLNGGSRRLEVLPVREKGPVRPVFGTRLLDPARPFPFFRSRAGRHSRRGRLHA